MGVRVVGGESVATGQTPLHHILTPTPQVVRGGGRVTAWASWWWAEGSCGMCGGVCGWGDGGLGVSVVEDAGGEAVQLVGLTLPHTTITPLTLRGTMRGG